MAPERSSGNGGGTMPGLPGAEEVTHGRLSVGYVVKTYPRLSETFILNEILALEERGVDITVFALHRPAEARFHEKLARVRADVKYAPDVRSTQVLEFLAARRTELDGLTGVASEMFWEALATGDPDLLPPVVAALATKPPAA